MGRKGKTPKEPALLLDKQSQWRDRGAFPITSKPLDRLDLSAEEATIADGIASTTLCTEHVPNEERPLECAKCGKPLALVQRAGERKLVETDPLSVLDALTAEERRIAAKIDGAIDKAIDDARQSEKRFDLGADDFPDPAAFDEWRDVDPSRAQRGPCDCDETFAFDNGHAVCRKCGARWPILTTEAERNAALCAVLTADQLAAVLDGVVADESSNLGRETRAADDGPAYEPRPTIRGILLEPLWAMRLSVLAKEEGCSETDYVQFLIRRQWVARGKGG